MEKEPIVDRNWVPSHSNSGGGSNNNVARTIRLLRASYSRAERRDTRTSCPYMPADSHIVYGAHNGNIMESSIHAFYSNHNNNKNRDENETKKNCLMAMQIEHSSSLRRCRCYIVGGALCFCLCCEIMIKRNMANALHLLKRARAIATFVRFARSTFIPFFRFLFANLSITRHFFGRRRCCRCCVACAFC